MSNHASESNAIAKLDAWDAAPLSALAERIMVGIASAATHAYRAKGIPMFRNQNIKIGHLDDSDLLFIAPEYESAFRNKRLRAGDLLTMRTGYPGVTAIVPALYEHAQSFTTLITRPKKDRVHSLFLCHYINSEFGQKFFEQSQIGGAQKNVNAGTLRGMPIPLPPPLEQKAIATALSDVDALIAGLERLIAKKRDIKQAAMQQLLTGQTRLPGFSGEWHQGVFGDVVSSLEAGVSVNSTDAEPAIDTPCVLKTSALVGGRFLPNEAKVIEPRDLGRARTSAKGDTILISRMNTPTLVGEVAYVAQDFDSLYLPDRVWMAQFNANKKTNVRWIAFVLSSQTYRDLLRDVATGTSGSMKNISKSALCSLPIRFPSPEEQTAIATVLSDIDADLSALESRLAKTRAIKQGMMQELLTGRTRLVAPGAPQHPGDPT